MTNLAILLAGIDFNEGAGLWLFLAIGAIVFFGVFLPGMNWIDSQRKEREAFYRAETIRRVAEASGEGAKAAMELLREQDRQNRIKKMEGFKIGGLINLFIGIALVIFMWVMLHGAHGPALAGLIPAAIGVAMLVYAFFMAEPVQ